jgi:hypothetical protein
MRVVAAAGPASRAAGDEPVGVRARAAAAISASLASGLP